MMEDIQQSVSKSLDSSNEELYDYLPYLLQDLWEIGASPQAIIDLLKKQQLPPETRVLDLGCGKGSVSVNIAKELGFIVHGIDGMPAFIDEAILWAEKFEVTHLCKFEVGDIREKVKNLSGFDVVILGSIGPVFGTTEKTLNAANDCITDEGLIVFDDGFIPEVSNFNSPNYTKENEFWKIITRCSLKVIEKYIFQETYMEQSDEFIYNNIERRANELMKKYPDKKQIFQGYLDEQIKENKILENDVECVTLLLKKV